MKRKVVKQGDATLMVSLPSKWAKECNIMKGSEVDVVEKGKDLIISPSSDTVKLIRKLSLPGNSESLIRTMITNAYRSGHDKLVVHFHSDEQFMILEHAVRSRLIGFDIVKKEENSCVIENITEPSSDQFDNILKKVFLNTHEIILSTKKKLTGIELSERLEDLEERIQSYDNFCRRISIKKNALLSNPEFFWPFMSCMIHAQRELYHLNRQVKKCRKNDKLLRLVDEIEAMFLLLVSSYEKKDMGSLSSIHEIEKKLVYRDGYALLRSSKPDELMMVHHLLSAIRNFYLASSPLMGLLQSTLV